MYFFILMATVIITMPKAKSKFKHEYNNNDVGLPYNNNNKSPAYNTRSAQKEKSLKKRENQPHANGLNTSYMKDDHMNLHRLLQLFPNFPPIYLQRIYALCNMDFVRTIDNVLYVKRYCLYLNQKKRETSLSLIGPIQNASEELPVVDLETLELFNISENDDILDENESRDDLLGLSDLEWMKSKCKTPELLDPKFTSTPL